MVGCICKKAFTQILLKKKQCQVYGSLESRDKILVIQLQILCYQQLQGVDAHLLEVPQFFKKKSRVQK